jgi:hypothetical protein
MTRFKLVLMVLWLSLRQRWYMSKWNPWGAASPGGRHRATRDFLAAMERSGAAFVRAAQATDETPSVPPNPPVQ